MQDGVGGGEHLTKVQDKEANGKTQRFRAFCNQTSNSFGLGDPTGIVNHLCHNIAIEITYFD
jgi:hypothetical protein